MVDVSDKAATERVAVAEGRVVMSKATLDLVLAGNAKKGDVLGTARIAGIMAAKRTHELIPLCHPLALSQSGRSRARSGAARHRRARDREGDRPDRRRDGGADRGVGRLPHHLRHGEGRRARHADRGHPASSKNPAASPAPTSAKELEPWRCFRSQTRLQRVLAHAAPLATEAAAARECAWPRARRRFARAAHASRRPTSRRWTVMRCGPTMSRTCRPI